MGSAQGHAPTRRLVTMKQFDCVLVNGDSYSAPAQSSQVYGDFLSHTLGIPIYNVAFPGSSNPRILRSSIEYINKLKQQHQNILVIVGWSFIRRLEVWYTGSNQKILDQIPDTAYGAQTRFVTLDHLLNAQEATLEQKSLINQDLFVHKQLMDFYTNLYLFANLLESQQLSYLFFSAAKNTDCAIHCFPYLESLEQVKWIINNKKIYQLHDFCIMDWAKANDSKSNPITGHLSVDGHEKFANFLLDQMLA